MTEKIVEVHGHDLTLFFSPGPSCCGETSDGVTFRFSGEGAWVIPLNELERIVAVAKARRAELAAHPTEASDA